MYLQILIPSNMAPPGPRRKTARNVYHHSHRRIRSVKTHKLHEFYGAKNYQGQLSTSYLNVDGLSDAKLADVTTFTEQRQSDLVFLFETKRREEEIGTDINIDGYELIEIRRSDTADDKQGGGIACYYKKNRTTLFKQYSPQIDHPDLAYVDNERLWVTVETQHTKTAICGVYFGCQFSDDRNSAWNDGMYWVLQHEVSSLRDQGFRVLIVGDFNAHIGSVVGQGIIGNNNDINKNGERLLQFLITCNMTHVNGALGQDGTSRICTGLWSRQRGLSRSIIDYAVLSSEHMDSVVTMFVDDNGVYGGGSDHNWSEIILRDKIANFVKVDTRAKRKQIWNIKDDQDWTAFKKSVVENIRQHEFTNKSEDELAVLVASIYNSAGSSSIGFKAEPKKASSKTTLPNHIVRALRQKLELGRSWKSLSTSGTAILPRRLQKRKLSLLTRQVL